MKPKRRGPRPDLDECKTFEFLHHHLVILQKSKKQLAEELGVSQATINHWTKHYDFGVNFHSQSNMGKSRPAPSEAVRRRISQKITQQYRNGRRPVNYKGRETRTCEICGEEFEVIKDSDNPKQRHKTVCSRTCADKKHSLYLQSRPKVEKVSITCAQCGKVFEVYPCLSHIQFCSYECVQVDRKGKTFEELHGPEKAQAIKHKLAIARAKQSQIYLTRPVKTLIEAIAPSLGGPEIEYQIEEYTVDLCYPSLNLVIEVDGDYWHNYPYGLERDKRKTQALEALGWWVCRCWENEILSDSAATVSRIMEAIQHD